MKSDSQCHVNESISLITTGVSGGHPDKYNIKIWRVREEDIYKKIIKKLEVYEEIGKLFVKR